ncbi:MAG: type II toxin-antitoxin system RelB/DinJ family antitoxin [Muribaculaceae bacterium]|nr:type II toxin-antitoxin system RelB/DinJ family antitoxin [Muribaculaceae bacterium]
MVFVLQNRYICNTYISIKSQATISIRVDHTLKKKFDSLCEAFGLSATSAFNMFMKAVVRERKIPFEIRADNAEITRQNAISAFKTMRQSLEESGVSEMTLDEINAEIMAARNERR